MENFLDDDDAKSGLYAIVWTDGQVTAEQMGTELIEGRWAPLLVYRKVDDPAEIVHLPVFTDVKKAMTFYQRNVPKDHLKAKAGLVSLGVKDIPVIEAKGWQFALFEYPNYIKDRTDIRMGFEIHEFPYAPKKRLGKS